MLGNSRFQSKNVKITRFWNWVSIIKQR